MFVGALSVPRSAFVGKAATSALGGGVCAVRRSAHRPGAATVRMADAGPRHWTRRELLLGLGAAVLGTLLGRSLPAEAKGEPKMSFFGADAQSSPFTYNEVQETPIFEGLTADDLKKYRETVMSAKARIEATSDAISKKSWEDIRSALRLALGTLRDACLKINQVAIAQGGPNEKKNIQKAYRNFLSKIEEMDYAAREKSVDKVERLRTAATAALDNWMTVVGL